MSRADQPRTPVVVDATPWSGSPHEPKLFAALADMFADPGELSIIVVVTPDQQGRLPDALGEREGLRFELAGEPGWDRARELAGTAGLLVSRRPFAELARWLALDLVDGEVELEPRDGLKQFAAAGALPAPAALAHPLAAIGIEADDREPIEPRSAIEARRFMVELADEDSPLCRGYAAIERAALARSLGVAATSTALERREYELGALLEACCEALGIEAGVLLTREELAAELDARRVLALPSTVARVDDELHVLVEPGKARGVPLSPRIRVHEIASRVVLVELLRELERRCEDDDVEDPCYDRLIERLGPSGDAALLVHHARATLLATGHRPTGAPAEPVAWPTALAAVVAEGPPPAELRVPVSLGTQQNLGRPTRWLDVDDRRRVLLGDRLAQSWRWLPPASPIVVVGRDAEVSAIEANYVLLNYEQLGRMLHGPSQRALLSLRLLDGDPLATWQGLVASSGALSPYLDYALIDYEQRAFDEGGGHWGQRERTDASLGLFERVDARRQRVGVAPESWTRADEHLALLWPALRAALTQAPDEVYHDGSVLLTIGGSLRARVSAVRRPARPSGARRALFDARLAQSRIVLDEHSTTLPKRLSLLADELQVTLQFTTELRAGA